MTAPLEGQVAIVTGGARGIGRGIALTLAGAGADILLADLLDDALDATAREVRALGRRAVAKVDVTQAAQVDAMVAQALADLGRLDILVNCAGVISIHPVDELTERDWDFVMDVNAKGTFLGCRAALAPLKAQAAAGSSTSRRSPARRVFRISRITAHRNSRSSASRTRLRRRSRATA